MLNTRRTPSLKPMIFVGIRWLLDTLCKEIRNAPRKTLLETICRRVDSRYDAITPRLIPTALYLS